MSVPENSAHVTWDRRWSSESGRRGWTIPAPTVAHIVPLLRERAMQDVIDIGCGIGRHALFFAQHGFNCIGIDASPSGLAYARTVAKEKRLQVRFVEAQFTSLPVDVGSIDYALAWNVIYHGTPESVRQAISEIHRVLRPGGLLQGTMLSTRHPMYGHGHQIAPDTFVLEDDDESDKVHPHFYCNASRFITLFDKFTLLELAERSHRSGPHWEFLIEKNH